MWPRQRRDLRLAVLEQLDVRLARTFERRFQTAVGAGGFLFAYGDYDGAPDAGTSKACLSTTAACVGGVAATLASGGPNYGAGIGLTLNQPEKTATPAGYLLSNTSSGITYRLSITPPSTGMYVIVDSAGVDYCAIITSASGTLSWTSFLLQCWNSASASGNVALKGPPDRSHPRRLPGEIGRNRSGAFRFLR